MENNNFEIPKNYLKEGRKKSECIDLNSSYMLIAMVSGLVSRDPSTQVGACIVDKNGNVISTGFNCPPKGWDVNNFMWDKLPEEEFNKYTYITHAEMNGLANFVGTKNSLEGASVYVTFLPCPNCAKNLIQNGIKKVVYLADGDNNLGSTKATKYMFEKCGIECIPFSKDNLENLKKVALNLESTDARNYSSIHKKKVLKKSIQNNNNIK
ncbi:MAG: cytidine deaminase [Bacilli bacterium]|nr:cytidine deaminase [Bacilli bacterium]